METFDKAIDIPLVPFQFGEELSGRFIGKEPIQIVALPRKEKIEIHCAFFLLFRMDI